MIHKLKIEPTENCPVCARVLIDDKPIRCRSLKIEHNVDEVPTIKLELIAIPECEMDAIVEIANMGEIASAMDKDEFERFCEMWRSIHKCKE